MEISGPQNTPQAHNRKRASYVSFLKRKNLKLVNQLKQYMEENDLSEADEDTVRGIEVSLKSCCNLSLYGGGSDIKYYASINCKKKYCFVCNWSRQKQLRRKYMAWFKDNEYLTLIRTKSGKLQAKSVAKSKSYPGMDVGQVGYDLMHLTLTVPHYLESGFRGNKYYFKEVASLYHYLRNESLFEIDGKKYRFDELIYGGEYGIECTAGYTSKNEQGDKVRKEDSNGLNIHIHSLLFVKKMRQSRNKIHRAILLEWNRITVNPDNPREVLTDYHRQQIAKGNSLLTAADIDSMHPKGATMIGMETIYTKDPRTGDKIRSTEFGDISMMRAIMETISYHFEPQAFDKADKTMNIPLMVEIAPKIKGLALFSKFGCLRGEKSLNISEKSITAEEEFLEVAEQLVDLDTGELIDKQEEYFITSPANIYAIESQDNKLILKKDAYRVMRFTASSSIRAVERLTDIANSQYRNKQTQKTITT